MPALKLRLNGKPVSVKLEASSTSEAGSYPASLSLRCGGIGMQTETYVQKALKLFDEGLSCAESVAQAGAQGIGVENELIPRVATGFHGGLCASRSLCGALAGAVIVLSAKYGRNDASGDKKVIDQKVRALVNEFRTEFGSDNCYELTNTDFTAQISDEDRAKVRAGCRNFVSFCTRRALQLCADD